MTGFGNASLVEVATTYARRGWPVVPLHSIVHGVCTCGKPTCRSAGKHPRTAHGVRDATCDEVRIERLLRGAVNIGIATGTLAGFVALDVDPRNGGSDSLARLERELGSLPSTVRSVTGGKGEHVYFQDPKQALRGRLKAGIDIKSNGGLLVAPPSVHASGRRYEWKHAPDEVRLAMLPSRWLASMIRPEPTAPMNAGHARGGHVDSRWLPPRCERIVRARAYAARMPPAISGNGGDNATFVTASKIATIP